MCSIGHDLRRPAAVAHVFAAKQVAHSGGGNDRAWPQRIDTNPVRLELSCMPKYAHAHAKLGHGVSHVWCEPARLHVEWRREVEYVWVVALLQMGQA